VHNFLQMETVFHNTSRQHYNTLRAWEQDIAKHKQVSSQPSL